jgi:TrkA-C domain
MNFISFRALLISTFRVLISGLKESATRTSRQFERLKILFTTIEIRKKIDSSFSLLGEYAYTRYREGLVVSTHDPKVLNLYATIRDLQTYRQTIEKQLGDLEEDDRAEDSRLIFKSIYIRGGHLLELKLSSRLSFLAEKPIHTLLLPSDSLIVAILRGDDLLIPRGSSVLHQGDIVFVLGEVKAIEQVKAWINALP